MELVESTKNEPDKPKWTTDMLLGSYVKSYEVFLKTLDFEQMILLNLNVTNLYVGKYLSKRKTINICIY